MNRRIFLHTTFAAMAGSAAFVRPVFAAGRSAASAAEQLHLEIWRRFIDRHGVMLDFTALDGSVDLPTPEECRAGKPNALGWWAPIENGAMFSGSYLDMMVNRWQETKSDADAAKARRLVEGLLLLNSVSDTKGFVARGVSTDGKSHYAMGSDDQTIPWFLGLWRFWQSGLASGAEKQRIKERFIETVEAIIHLGWRMPAEPPFGTRGDFTGFEFDGAARRVFVLKAMHAVTGDAKWETAYRAALKERGGKANLSRFQVCEGGMTFWYSKRHNWTCASSVGALRGLWEMESDAKTKAAFARGLAASARLAAESLPLAMQFNHSDGTTFNTDWRTAMLPFWKPQTTARESWGIAGKQLSAFLKRSPRRGMETAFIREPASAAWIVSLCPDPAVVKPYVAGIERVIAHYDYARLYYCTFFWLEGAWWRLQGLK